METQTAAPEPEDDRNPDAAEQQENNKRVVGKPFPKGTSGNPTGRPKGAVSIIGHIRKLLAGEDEARAKQLAEALILQSAKGNGVAIRQLLDRIDGPVTQKVVLEVAEDATTDALLVVLARRYSEEEFDAIVSDWQQELIRSGSNSANISSEPGEPEPEPEQP